MTTRSRGSWPPASGFGCQLQTLSPPQSTHLWGMSAAIGAQTGQTQVVEG